MIQIDLLHDLHHVALKSIVQEHPTNFAGTSCTPSLALQGITTQAEWLPTYVPLEGNPNVGRRTPCHLFQPIEHNIRAKLGTLSGFLIKGQQFSGACVSIGPVWGPLSLALWHLIHWGCDVGTPTCPSSCKSFLKSGTWQNVDDHSLWRMVNVTSQTAMWDTHLFNKTNQSVIGSAPNSKLVSLHVSQPIKCDWPITLRHGCLCHRLPPSPGVEACVY